MYIWTRPLGHTVLLHEKLGFLTLKIRSFFKKKVLCSISLLFLLCLLSSAFRSFVHQFDIPDMRPSMMRARPMAQKIPVIGQHSTSLYIMKLREAAKKIFFQWFFRVYIVHLDHTPPQPYHFANYITLPKFEKIITLREAAKKGSFLSSPATKALPAPLLGIRKVYHGQVGPDFPQAQKGRGQAHNQV